MSLNYKGIADALAAKYSSLTPPNGYTAIALATAELPNAFSQTPSVAVFGIDGSLVNLPSYEEGEHRFKVRFLYAQTTGDQPRDLTALYLWLPVLLNALNTGIQLGLGASNGGNVVKTLNTGYRLGDFTYAGITYLCIEIDVTVWTRDVVTLTP